MVEVVGQNVHKYSSSTRVNLWVTATRGLSPAISQGSGEWTKVAGAIGVWITGYGSLNVDGPCIHDGVRGVSNCECTIRLNGSIKVLGIPLAGDEVGYLGGGSHEWLVGCRRRQQGESSDLGMLPNRYQW